MVAPPADGLFQRVLLDSPGAMRHWTPLREAEERGARLGDISALRQLPAGEVPLVQNLGGSRGVRPLFEPRVLGPTLDGVLLKEEEREAFEGGRMNKVDVLVGNVADEGATFTAAYPVKSVDAYREFLRSPAIFGPLGDEALALYPAASDADVARAIADSFGDSQFTFGARGIARAMSLVRPHVWRYWFSRPANGGAGHAPWHGAQVRYVMGGVDGPQYNEDDKVLSDLMMDAWVRFAATGNPNGGAIRNWPPYDVKSDPLMILDVRPAVAFGLRNAQLDFIGRVQRATRR
jgi:para-nitrobenzyl esterase